MKKMKWLILFCMLMNLLPAVASAQPVEAVSTTSSIFVNDERLYINGYNINGNNYFKLRDLAAALKGTNSRFDVVWNAEQNSIGLKTGLDYSGDEVLGNSWSLTEKTAVASTASLNIDGAEVDVEAYNIEDNNYYKLRDLGEGAAFEVYWNEEQNSVCIYTASREYAVQSGGRAGYNDYMTPTVSTSRWSDIVRSYIYDNGDDTFTALELYNDGESYVIDVDIYKKDTYALLSSRTVPFELEFFGGFYPGEEYNYIVFGADNTEEDDSREVIRVVKYDKNFERVAALSVNGGEAYTVLPFSSGSLRMAENNGELVVHTARKRYTTSDGLNHQSQLTIIIDTDSMTVKNTMGEFQPNHVSHSFNQFVKYDNDMAVLIDHGDAYPRSIVMNQYTDGSFKEFELFKIPGTAGANCTGVTVGGFEVSEDNYIVAMNSVDHSKVTNYTSFEMTGLEQDERDIVLLVSDKGNSENVKQVVLTNYVGQNKLGSTPYLVKLDNDRFAVLWQEFEYLSGNTYPNYKNNGVKYVEINGSGEQLSEMMTVEDIKLSSDCQPVYMDGEIVWYIDSLAGRMFYHIGI